MGHSLGGLTAAYVAAKSPELVRGALLEDPPLFLGDRETFESTEYATLFRLAQQALRGAQSADDPEAAIRGFIELAPAPSGGGTLGERLGPEGVALRARIMARFDPEAFTPALDQTLFAAHDPDAPLACPLRVLRAEPELNPAFWPEHEERLAKIAPQARVVLAEGCSHMIHGEQPAWFQKQVEDFLGSI